MGYEVWIYTNEKRPKYIYGRNSLVINVTEENPWDPLSKVFKKVTHTIQYSPSGGYVPSEYSNSVLERFIL